MTSFTIIFSGQLPVQSLRAERKIKVLVVQWERDRRLWYDHLKNRTIDWLNLKASVPQPEDQLSVAIYYTEPIKMLKVYLVFPLMRLTPPPYFLGIFLTLLRVVSMLHLLYANTWSPHFHYFKTNFASFAWVQTVNILHVFLCELTLFHAIIICHIHSVAESCNPFASTCSVDFSLLLLLQKSLTVIQCLYLGEYVPFL